MLTFKSFILSFTISFVFFSSLQAHADWLQDLRRMVSGSSSGSATSTPPASTDRSGSKGNTAAPVSPPAASGPTLSVLHIPEATFTDLEGCLITPRTSLVTQSCNQSITRAFQDARPNRQATVFSCPYILRMGMLKIQMMIPDLGKPNVEGLENDPRAQVDLAKDQVFYKEIKKMMNPSALPAGEKDPTVAKYQFFYTASPDQMERLAKGLEDAIPIVLRELRDNGLQSCEAPMIRYLAAKVMLPLSDTKRGSNFFLEHKTTLERGGWLTDKAEVYDIFSGRILSLPFQGEYLRFLNTLANPRGDCMLAGMMSHLGTSASHETSLSCPNRCDDQGQLQIPGQPGVPQQSGGRGGIGGASSELSSRGSTSSLEGSAAGLSGGGRGNFGGPSQNPGCRASGDMSYQGFSASSVGAIPGACSIGEVNIQGPLANDPQFKNVMCHANIASGGIDLMNPDSLIALSGIPSGGRCHHGPGDEAKPGGGEAKKPEPKTEPKKEDKGPVEVKSKDPEGPKVIFDKEGGAQVDLGKSNPEALAGEQQNKLREVRDKVITLIAEGGVSPEQGTKGVKALTRLIGDIKVPQDCANPGACKSDCSDAEQEISEAHQCDQQSLSGLRTNDGRSVIRGVPAGDSLGREPRLERSTGEGTEQRGPDACNAQPGTGDRDSLACKFSSDCATPPAPGAGGCCGVQHMSARIADTSCFKAICGQVETVGPPPGTPTRNPLPPPGGGGGGVNPPSPGPTNLNGKPGVTALPMGNVGEGRTNALPTYQANPAPNTQGTTTSARDGSGTKSTTRSSSQTGTNTQQPASSTTEQQGVRNLLQQMQGGRVQR